MISGAQQNSAIIGLMILLLGFSPVQNLGEKLGNPKSGSAVLK